MRSFNNGVETSEVAATRTQELQRVNRIRIRAFLTECGKAGATDQEIETATGIPGNSERPARLKLVKQGVVVDTGKTRNTRAGLPAIVWAVVAPRSRKPARKRDRLQQNKRDITDTPGQLSGDSAAKPILEWVSTDPECPGGFKAVWMNWCFLCQPRGGRWLGWGWSSEAAGPGEPGDFATLAQAQAELEDFAGFLAYRFETGV